MAEVRKNPAEEIAAKLVEIDAVLGRLREKEAALDARLASPVSAMRALSILDDRKPPPLDPKYKGSKTYRLQEPHYRLGQMYGAGSVIVVFDEKPGKSWIPLDPNAPAAPAPTFADTATQLDNTMSGVSNRPSDRAV